MRRPVTLRRRIQAQAEGNHIDRQKKTWRLQPRDLFVRAVAARSAPLTRALFFSTAFPETRRSPGRPTRRAKLRRNPSVSGVGLIRLTRSARRMNPSSGSFCDDVLKVPRPDSFPQAQGSSKGARASPEIAGRHAGPTGIPECLHGAALGKGPAGRRRLRRGRSSTRETPRSHLPMLSSRSRSRSRSRSSSTERDDEDAPPRRVTSKDRVAILR